MGFAALLFLIIPISLVLKSCDNGKTRTKPISTPPQSSFIQSIAGVGITESNTTNINIGTFLSGIIQDVYVTAGSQVNKGDPLFALNKRSYLATVDYRKGLLQQAEGELSKLEAMPRKEELPPLEAKVGQTASSLKDAELLWNNVASLEGTGAIDEETLLRRKIALGFAKYQHKEAEDQLALLKAGAWKYDIDIAKANVAIAKAALEQAEVDLDHTVVKAPVSGTVLQSNINPGEFAQTGILATPLIVMGNIRPLNVRVNIDEKDSHLFDSTAPAYAMKRGDSQTHYPLQFVRVEFLAVPKTSLTGSTLEKVDTRVFQVIYALPEDTPNLYAGEQMDVFIENPKAKADISQKKT